MARFEIDLPYLLKTLADLLETPSPTGDTDYATAFIQGELSVFDVKARLTPKGSLVAELEGLKKSAPRGLAAHVDTLGAIVAEVKSSGRLRLSALGSLMWPSVESEGVKIATRSGRQVRGSLVLVNGAAHVNKEAHTLKRSAETMEVRVDERTSSAEETRLLGVEVGDFVYFDPRAEFGDAGFVRSRFLDDKACAACLLAAVKAIRDAQITPAQHTSLLFSSFEEVGHGGSEGLANNLHELVVLDMACIGEGLSGDEFHCSICVKDAGGPYSRGLTDKLRGIANQRGIDLKADVYPFYGSDGAPYWKSGGSAQVALIGPGVDTSHGYERTHQDALLDTASLIAEYLVED